MQSNIPMDIESEQKKQYKGSLLYMLEEPLLKIKLKKIESERINKKQIEQKLKQKPEGQIDLWEYKESGLTKSYNPQVWVRAGSNGNQL